MNRYCGENTLDGIIGKQYWSESDMMTKKCHATCQNYRYVLGKCQFQDNPIPRDEINNKCEINMWKKLRS